MDARPLLRSLTQLIQSLSVAQKRHFKMYAGAGGENTARYIRLFDAVNKHAQEHAEPDDNLGAELVKKKIVRSHELSQVAGYLYDKILESMRKTPESQQGHAEITGYLKDCRFLLDKELFEDCKALLKKTADLLSKYDYPTLDLERLMLERRLLTSWGERLFDRRLEEIHGEIDRILERLQQDNELFRHNVTILKSFYLSKPLPQETNLAIHRYMLRISDPGLACGTRYRLVTAIANYHRLTPAPRGPVPPPEFVMPSIEQEFLLLENALEQMTGQQRERDENPGDFLQLLVRYLASALDNGRWDRFQQYSARLEKYENTAEFYRSFAYLYLFSFLKKRAFGEGEAYILRFKLRERLFQPNYRIRPSRLATICFYCAMIQFIRRNGGEAFFWLEKIIGHKPPESLPDLRCAARFLRILTVLDTNSLSREHDPADLCARLGRWLTEKRFDDAFYRTALELLLLVCVENRPKKEKMAAALERLKALYPEKKAYESFGLFIAWFESRLDGKPLDESSEPYL